MKVRTRQCFQNLFWEKVHDLNSTAGPVAAVKRGEPEQISIQGGRASSQPSKIELSPDRLLNQLDFLKHKIMHSAPLNLSDKDI